MKSSAVTTRGAPGESYDAFTKRTEEDSARVASKLASLNRFIPCCRYCGETCNPGEAGATCKENNSRMASQWARAVAGREWYRLGHFGGAWAFEVESLACLLDRVRAGALDDDGPRSHGKGR